MGWAGVVLGRRGVVLVLGRVGVVAVGKCLRRGAGWVNGCVKVVLLGRMGKWLRRDV